MRRKLSILLILVAIVLSYSFAAADDTDFWKDLAKGVLKGLEESAKQGAQKNREEELNKKLDGLVRKLPAAARVAVLEIKVKTPEFETPESNPEDEDFRIRTIKGLQLSGEQMRDGLEEGLGESSITILDRDTFNEIEKEIVYSQTGEVDPSTSAKFGKAVGATHFVIGKIIYNGFKTGHPTMTFSIKITEIESSKRIGSVNFTKELDIGLPKESTTTTSQRIQKQTLVNETFYVNPGADKVYSWNFPVAGSLDISLDANSDIFLYVVDNENYAAYAAGRGFRGFEIKERITSANFSMPIPKGLHYIVISNGHSVFTSAGVVLSVSYKPKQ